MENDIERILGAAITAPSGENAQPWQFRIKGNLIYLFNVPERDQSLYNFDQKASYFTHGAVLENISLAASFMGYAATIDLSSNRATPNLVAIIKLDKSGAKDTPLYPYIEKRTTNRKSYKIRALNNEERDALLKFSSGANNAKLLLTEDKKALAVLARAASANERILFENEQLRDFFFSHINWTEEEERKRRFGFYIKTLELPPPAIILLRLASKYRWFLKISNTLGLPKLIAKQNAQLYQTASAIGIIVIKDSTPLDFLNAGRLMQCVWLTATKLGLSIQPLAGLLLLAHRIANGEKGGLTIKHTELIKENYDKIKKVFDLRDETTAMMFRVGDGGIPSAKSLRLPLEQVAIIER